MVYAIYFVFYKYYAIIVQHTSAALSISENYDPDVRADMATVMDRLVPENNSLYTHTMEGPDDMPAHAKTALLGNQITIPSIYIIFLSF